MEDDLIGELTCPITMELFEDPVTVPCCGKAFSRQALLEHHKNRPFCPLCSSSLKGFHVQSAAKNVILSSMIESIQLRERNPNPQSDINNKEETFPQNNKELQNHRWSCEFTGIHGGDCNDEQIGELRLFVEDSKFSCKPSMFIACVDRSGSMSGAPWKQVETALIHIMGLQRHNESLVKVVVIGYESYAEIIDLDHPSQNEVHRRIRSMFTGGGTNFRNAFHKVKEVLSNSKAMREISNVAIAFLTDGQDNQSGDKKALAPEFKEILNRCWVSKGNPVSVHAIGFSRSCDKNFLEGVRLAGSIEGTFRYAEPNDDGDTLCQKLTGVFDICSKSSSVPLTIKLQEFHFCDTNLESPASIQFPVDRTKFGEQCFWVKLDQNANAPSCIINSQFDNDVLIPVTICHSGHQNIFQRWLSTLIDRLAAETLSLSENKECPVNVRDLHCALLEQRVDAIRLSLSSAGSEEESDRLDFIAGQIGSVRAGVSVNLGKLSDIRFASLFGKETGEKKAIRSVPSDYPESLIKPIDDKPHFERHLKRYSRNNDGKKRNQLQEAIISEPFNILKDELKKMIQSSSEDDISYKDVDGNNALMLASFCGHSKIIECILLSHPKLDVNLDNPDSESALTLAIKKRGFHFTVGFLLESGAMFPRNRRSALERYAIENGYSITAEIISKFGDSTDIDVSMTPEYISFVYKRLTSSGKEINVQQFLDVALGKQLLDLAQELMDKHGGVPSLDMLITHCLPKKPDAPDTPLYLELAELVLARNPELLHQTTAAQESPLFMAARAGSLPHVQFFIEKGAQIDQPNEKGNTPLWVSCFMRWPCIIEELLDKGADINWMNLKGNIPIYGACERGSVKVAEILVARGSKIDHFNENGDTLILLCCRNGQHEVLEFLLNYVDDDFVNHKAHIDGFNAIMASAESNRPDCVRVLHEYGCDLNQKTDDDNEILGGATPLHIASYYGRTDAAKALISLGADPNSTDINNNTAMHIAVIQGNLDIIKLLRNSGTNLNAKDSSGNTPISYTRNRPEIRNILVDPALDPLMKLAKGGMSREEESIACDVLRRFAGAPGCLPPAQAVDVHDYDGSTILMQAVIHSMRNVVEVLLDLGANVCLPNSLGLYPMSWAKWIRNQRISSLLSKANPNFDMKLIEKHLENLENAAKDRENSTLLFLGNKAPFTLLSSSGINLRMAESISSPSFPEATSDFVNELLRITSSNTAVVSYFEKKDFQDLDTSLVWNGKVFTTGLIASGTNSLLKPKEIMALAMYTSNPFVSRIVNSALQRKEFPSNNVKEYAGVLLNAIKELPEFHGEAYIGTAHVDRKLFQVGAEFLWPAFISSSSLWRVATENTPSFASKSKKGTIFILQSKTGRFVGQYSQFSFDSEVIFLPFTLFRVKNWYHGDVIALGQANIREHSYSVKEVDDERITLDRMLTSDKSLIIELEEV